MTAPQQGHTPGPWNFLAPSSKNSALGAVMADGSPVATAYGETREEREANARLIAAAPDLLAALHDIANHAAMGRPLSAESLARIAAAAIAKATA